MTAVCLLAAGCGTGDAPDSRSVPPPAGTAWSSADRLTLGPGSDRQGEQTDR
ncbi:hypothetical protein IHE61_16860 [Streptomyces sp. GKU 257-1]|nr:hypothetical protein [Streptomyces sp. GKU 257-1]